MNPKRIAEVALVFSAICAFVHTTYLTLNAENAEALFVALFFMPLVILALFKEPNLVFSRRKHWLVAIGLVAIMVTKHRMHPVETHLHSLISFSLVFNLGKAVGLLAILELYQKRIRNHHTFLILYSTLVVAAASYTSVTQYLSFYLVVYTALLVWLTRVRLGDEQSGFSGRLWRGVFIVPLLLISYTTAQVLAHYRHELSNWDPAAMWHQQKHRVGFSPITKLGSKNIQTSRQVVLRYFAPPGIYRLRGKAFDLYEKSQWHLSRDELRTLVGERQSGEKFSFSLADKVDMAPGSYRLLFMDAASPVIFTPLGCYGIVQSSPHLYMNREGIIRTSVLEQGAVVNQLLLSEKSWRKASAEDLAHKDRYTQLPDNADYFRQLSEKIAPQGSVAEKIAQITTYLAKNYPYTTNTVLDQGQEPIENFLRNKRGGHCEMFASALVMLARAQNIPCRYVAGYYAYEWNALGEFHTIRACDAHAWTEVLLPEKGWIIVDPTPPGEVERTLEQNRGFAEQYREWLAEIWRQWTVAIAEIFSSLGWIGTSLVFLGFFYLLFIITTRAKKLWRQRKSRQQQEANISPLARRLSQLAAEFGSIFGKKYHRSRQKMETLREYWQLIAPQLPDSLHEPCEKFLYELEFSLYCGHLPKQDDIERLEGQWRQIAHRIETTP